MVERLEKGSSSRRKNQTWWTEEVAKAIGEKGEIWKMIQRDQNVVDRRSSKSNWRKGRYGR